MGPRHTRRGRIAPVRHCLNYRNRNMWNWLQGLIGNNGWAKYGVFAFILILCLAFCHKANAGEVDVRAGSSFGTEGYGPVLGLQLRAPLAGFNQVNWYAGTLLWGKTEYR